MGKITEAASFLNLAINYEKTVKINLLTIKKPVSAKARQVLTNFNFTKPKQAFLPQVLTSLYQTMTALALPHKQMKKYLSTSPTS